MAEEAVSMTMGSTEAYRVRGKKTTWSLNMGWVGGETMT